MTDTDTFVVTAAGLHAAVVTIFGAAGSEAREATLIADHLVESNLTGHDSHGVGVLPNYVAAAREGRRRLNGRGRIVLDSGAMLTLDGDNAFGQVIAYEAMQLGIERALSFSVAVVAMRNAGHIGRVGHWAEQCAAAGYVSVHFVAGFANRAVVAAHGGTDPRFITNPFCAGFPIRGGDPVILDFATSAIAAGKARVAMNRGEPVPEGTLLDASGQPTTDPKALFARPHGALLPLGGHKGFGLGVICELLAGALTGGGTWHDGNAEHGAMVNNMLSIIVDPARLGGHETMAEEANRFAAWLKASRLAPGVDEILLPGEPERQRKRTRLANGIPVDAVTWGEVLMAAESVGVPRVEIARVAGLA